MKYYEVVAKCGHVGGREKYILISFFIAARDGKAAAADIRVAPRVQSYKKDAILSVTQIDWDRYLEGRAAYEADPYTNCHNSQELKLVWEAIESRVMHESVPAPYRTKEKNKKRALRYGYGRETWRGEFPLSMKIA